MFTVEMINQKIAILKEELAKLQNEIIGMVGKRDELNSKIRNGELNLNTIYGKILVLNELLSDNSSSQTNPQVERIVSTGQKVPAKNTPPAENKVELTTDEILKAARDSGVIIRNDRKPQPQRMGADEFRNSIENEDVEVTEVVEDGPQPPPSPIGMRNKKNNPVMTTKTSNRDEGDD